MSSGSDRRYDRPSSLDGDSPLSPLAETSVALSGNSSAGRGDRGHRHLRPSKVRRAQFYTVQGYCCCRSCPSLDTKTAISTELPCVHQKHVGRSQLHKKVDSCLTCVDVKKDRRNHHPCLANYDTIRNKYKPPSCAESEFATQDAVKLFLDEIHSEWAEKNPRTEPRDVASTGDYASDRAQPAIPVCPSAEIPPDLEYLEYGSNCAPEDVPKSDTAGTAATADSRAENVTTSIEDTRMPLAPATTLTPAPLGSPRQIDMLERSTNIPHENAFTPNQNTNITSTPDSARASAPSRIPTPAPATYPLGIDPLDIADDINDSW